MGPNPSKRSWLSRIARGALLVGLGILAVMAWMLGPAWFRMIQDRVSPELGRRIAIIYLNGVLVGYALALAGSVGVIGSVLADADEIAG